MTEADIVCDDGEFWVYRDRSGRAYTVFRNLVTHAEADSSYPLTNDGMSLAIARCHYLAQRHREEPKS